MAARGTQAARGARARRSPSGCQHRSSIRRRGGPWRGLLPKDRETRVTMATILVVDDEKNYLWMLEELFQGEGYEVLTCERAEEALPLLAAGPRGTPLAGLARGTPAPPPHPPAPQKGTTPAS